MLTCAVLACLIYGKALVAGTDVAANSIPTPAIRAQVAKQHTLVDI